VPPDRSHAEITLTIFFKPEHLPVTCMKAAGAAPLVTEFEGSTDIMPATASNAELSAAEAHARQSKRRSAVECTG
jgi:hypothetical protein